MSFAYGAAGLALVLAAAAPTQARAFGFPGCPDLPEYNRALGTLQGLSTCGMTVEEARRVVAAHDGSAATPRQVEPSPPAYRRSGRKPPRHGRAHGLPPHR